MTLFVDEDKIINNPQSYRNILLDNRTKSIHLVIDDIEINHKLIIERLYINDYECHVNTRRGNYILNTEDPKLHLVFYNKRWFSIGRDNALPLLNKDIDKQMIINNQFTNCKFGEDFIQTPTYSSNNGSISRYYISDRLLVSAKDYHQGNLGCIFVYSRTSTDYNVLEDILTIPYNSTQGIYQGQFGAKFDLVDMNGYHYLIVCAPNRKFLNSSCSVYIYSYRKRSDQTFYFQHETFDKEIIVPRITSFKTLTTTKNKGFHLVFDKEIITYYISSYDSETIRISPPYSVSTTQDIKDIKSTDNHVYVLFDTSITKYSIPLIENSLVELTTPIDDFSGNNIHSLIVDASEGMVVVSHDKIYFYNDQQIKTNTFTELSSNILSVDLFNKNSNQILFLLQNGDTKTLTNKTTSQLRGIVSSVSNTSKIRYFLDDSTNLLVGIPSLSGGQMRRITISEFTTSTTNNYKNISTQPEILVSDDAENVYVYDRRTKIITVLIRNPKNEFILSHTIHPPPSTLKLLRFRDTILDVKTNHVENQLLIGVRPYNDTKSYVLVCNLETYSHLATWMGTTVGFGTSIDIEKNTAIVSDPNVVDAVISGIHYQTGTIDMYNLKPMSNFVKINLNSLRSTSPIGKVAKLASNLNEIISVGANSSGVHSVTWFGNINDINYRRFILNENVTDVEYFLEGRLVLTSKDNTNKFYRNQKVNGCFEIITKRDITIPSLTSIGTPIRILPLGKFYTFMYYPGKILMFDIRDMRLIKEWTDSYTSNVSVCIDGSTISYLSQTSNDVSYIICS